MEDLPLFSWKGRSYGSKIVIRAFFTAFSTPDHFALLPTVGWQGAPFYAESAYLSCRSPSSVGSRLLLRSWVPLDIRLGHHLCPAQEPTPMSNTANPSERGRFSAPRKAATVLRLLRG